MGYEWQFTPDPERQEGRSYQWPVTPSLPNRFYPGYFKASVYAYFLEEVSGLYIDNPDVVTREEVVQIAEGLRAYYNQLPSLSDDAPIASFQSITYQEVRDLLTLFAYAAQHNMHAVGH